MLIYVSILDERMPIIKKVNHCNAALDKEDASEIFYSALNQQSSCFMWNFFMTRSTIILKRVEEPFLGKYKKFL